jgi:hypothetical protein
VHTTFEEEPEPLKIINLTPHDVVFYSADGTTTTFPKSENPARVAVKRILSHDVVADEGIFPVYKSMFGAIENLPTTGKDHYIVSRVVAESAKDLRWLGTLLIPDDTVRDCEGKIIGCRAFAII